MSRFWWMGRRWATTAVYAVTWTPPGPGQYALAAELRYANGIIRAPVLVTVEDGAVRVKPVLTANAGHQRKVAEATQHPTLFQQRGVKRSWRSRPRHGRVGCRHPA
ncbi:MAG: hypothetical protein R2838_06845 [Caldilineaceae bacterium]